MSLLAIRSRTRKDDPSPTSVWRVRLKAQDPASKKSAVLITTGHCLNHIASVAVWLVATDVFMAPGLLMLGSAAREQACQSRRGHLEQE
jgi:hypothetical protein